MAQREGSIYLTLFIVAMVLFVVAVVAFFVVYNEQELLRTQLAQAQQARGTAESSLAKVNGELTDLKKLAIGRDVQGPVAPVLEEANAKLKAVEQVIKAAWEKDGKDPGQVTYGALIEPYEDVDQALQTQQSLRDQLAAEKTQIATKLSAEVERYDATIAGLNAQIATLTSQKAEADSRYETCETQRSADKEESVRKVTELEEQITDLEIRSNRQVAMLNNQISTLQSKITRILAETRAEEEFAELEPDGRLFKVVPNLQKGWIDIGREHHLMPGMVFRVFQSVKGGRKVHKGRVEVRRVEDRMAEVQVIEELDSIANPITDGDFIASPFYDQGETPIFVFAGQELSSKNVTMDYLQAKLRNYGVEIRKAVDVNTTFLVALVDYDKQPEYRTAQELGVPILREPDVLEFIGY